MEGIVLNEKYVHAEKIGENPIQCQVNSSNIYYTGKLFFIIFFK